MRLEIFMYVTLFLILISCKESKTNNVDKVSSLASTITRLDTGFIISSELFKDRYFRNKPYFFIPVYQMNKEYSMHSFESSNLKKGIQFNLYSDYYIKLINCMSLDINSYKIADSKQKHDPFRLAIEIRRVIPVVISYEVINNEIAIHSDTFFLDMYGNRNIKYKADFIGAIKIKELEILLPKEDEINYLGSPQQNNPYGFFENKPEK